MAFRGALDKAGIWGQRIQGMAAQQALEEAIAATLQSRQFRHIFSRLGQSDLQKDFRRLAQILNRNERRRKQRSHDRRVRKYGSVSSGAAQSAPYISPPRSHSPAEVDSQSSSTPPPAQSPPAQSPPAQSLLMQLTPAVQPLISGFESNTIVVRRHRGEVRTYRPSDFCSKDTKSGQIKVDDLVFEEFVNVLSNEMEYQPGQDTLSYQCPASGKIRILGERAWRAALWDMHSQGQRHLIFMIQRR